MSPKPDYEQQELVLQLQSRAPLLLRRWWKEKDKKELSEEELLERNLYRIGPRSYGFPVTGFRHALIQTAAYVRPGSDEISEKKLHFRSRVDVKPLIVVVPEDDSGELVKLKTGKPTAHVIQVPRSRKSKKMEDRIVARFENWQATLRLRFLSKFVEEEFIRTLVRAAGIRQGIGTKRPEKKGNYGTFRIVS